MQLLNFIFSSIDESEVKEQIDFKIIEVFWGSYCPCHMSTNAWYCMEKSEVVLETIDLQSAGGVRCLSILNAVSAIVFGLLALFLGSSLLTLGNSCSVPLFWCYEVASWSLVILYGGTAFFLRRKAAVILDEGDFGGRNVGLEMLEAGDLEVTPEVERRVNEGFRTWMGSSLLSSDEEDEPDSYQEVPHLTRTNSNIQTT